MPTVVPMTATMNAPSNPTNIAMRDPKSSWESTSYPASVVPSGCESVGGRSDAHDPSAM